ncbi:MAG: S-adenosyl-l-methionine hydroxide adenosyltransferase family protein [Bradymonadaceae bacterium]
MSDPTISILTDFGREDTYVGLMKTVMAQICPDVRFVDLCHEIPPQNVLSAAYLAASSAPYLQPGAVLLAVIDPGVGSGRRALAARAGDIRVVGPDNGLFALLFERLPPENVVSLENSDYFLDDVSTTFHGRDIFAPVAAHIAAGVPLEELGPDVDPDDLTGLPATDVHATSREMSGQVIHIDRFGNLITNVREPLLADWLDGESPLIDVCGSEIPLRDTFSSVPQGQPTSYIGSTGHLEIAVNRGDASRYLGASQGTDVHVRREPRET